MTVKSRFVATLCALMLTVTAGVAASGGVAAAASRRTVSDVIKFSSHVYLTLPTETGPGHFSLIGDRCELTSDGESPVPCTIAGTGTVTATGGKAIAAITSRDGVIILDETYVFTGPTTSTGTGSAIEVENNVVTRGTFVGKFTAVPTATSGVLIDRGTITVRERSGPGDPSGQ